MKVFRIGAGLAFGAVMVLSGMTGALAKQSSLVIAPGSTVYDCQMGMHESFIPPRILLIRDPSTHKVAVYDGYVKSVYGRPLWATTEEDTTQHLMLIWTVKNLKGDTNRGSSTNVDIHYNATYVTGSRSITMTAQVMGYVNPESQGTGSCTQR
ncbi:hypothetical protein GALL_445600 [mine drainage metagenome]|uniref:Uncharacterized protein n=1 Tax=mine drainage metagenome TaxID=410659 RepID=A0A1J5PQM1_9ZZZZ